MTKPMTNDIEEQTTEVDLPETKKLGFYDTYIRPNIFITAASTVAMIFTNAITFIATDLFAKSKAVNTCTTTLEGVRQCTKEIEQNLAAEIRDFLSSSGGITTTMLVVPAAIVTTVVVVRACQNWRFLSNTPSNDGKGAFAPVAEALDVNALKLSS